MHKEKTERVLKALNDERPDRVPVTEWFWNEFVKKWRREKKVDEGGDRCLRMEI